MVRNEERMTLSGKVTIPEADVNLQKLPRGGDKAQAASPDVVVVDDEAQEEAAEQAIPFTRTSRSRWAKRSISPVSGWSRK